MALAENRYGKSRIRLVRVKRHRERHDFREWTLEILLQGDFESCFTDGDNSKILATDTMKNTVYSLARDSSATCMEEFGKELIDFLLRRNPQVSRAEVIDIGKGVGAYCRGWKAAANRLRSIGQRAADDEAGARAGRKMFGHFGT